MKLSFVIVFISLQIAGFAQKTPIFKSFNPVEIEEYIRLNDISFVWAFSKNSCSYTEDSLNFDNQELANFYSSKFSCFAVCIDSTFNTDRNLFKISEPGYYFFDSTYRIVHKHLKRISKIQDLIRLGDRATDTNLRYNTVKQRFNSGDRGVVFLTDYLETRKYAKELTSQDIDEFIQIIDTTNDTTDLIRNFVYNYFFCRTYDKGYYFFTPGSAPFNLLLKKRNWLLEKFDTLQIDLRINALLNFGLRALIKGENLDLILASASFFNNTIETFILKNTDDEILLYLKGNIHDTINKISALKAFYYLEAGDTANYLKCEQEFLELSKGDYHGLFFLANYYYHNYDNDLKIKSIGILRKAYELNQNDYEIVGLLAQALYECADYEQALVFIEKAIKLYTENLISPSQFISLRDDIIMQQKASSTHQN